MDLLHKNSFLKSADTDLLTNVSNQARCHLRDILVDIGTTNFIQTRNSFLKSMLVISDKWKELISFWILSTHWLKSHQTLRNKIIE